MTEQTSSQTQQIRDAWRKAMSEQAERVESAFAEMTKLEEKGIEQACNNFDEMARLTKVSFAYAGELAAQWRKLYIDAVRRTADLACGPKED